MAKNLKLGMDAARSQVVGGGEIVFAQHVRLEDIDKSDEEPSDGDDDGHGEEMPEVGFDLLGQTRNEGQHNLHAGEHQNRATGATEVGLNSPVAFGDLGRLVAEDAKDDPVDHIGKKDGRAEKKDGKEPSVLLQVMEVVGHLISISLCGFRCRQTDGEVSGAGTRVQGKALPVDWQGWCVTEHPRVDFVEHGAPEVVVSYGRVPPTMVGPPALPEAVERTTKTTSEPDLRLATMD
jgi:hypothetical protein